MNYHDWARLIIGVLTAVVVVGISIQLWVWHHTPDKFSLKDYFTAPDKKGIERPSRAALGELVSLFATTSAYMSVLAVKPELYPESTLIYGGIWAVRGGYNSYLKSKGKQ